MQGRVHLYEGHPTCRSSRACGRRRASGSRACSLTNAAGGLEPSWAAAVLMTCHRSPQPDVHHAAVSGPNEEALGPRFPDMTNAYDEALREMLAAWRHGEASAPAKACTPALLGPTYQTPAEVRMLRVFRRAARGHEHGAGGDRAPPHGRARRALRCITNLAAGVGKGELDHRGRGDRKGAPRGFERLLRGWILIEAGKP